MEERVRKVQRNDTAVGGKLVGSLDQAMIHRGGLQGRVRGTLAAWFDGRKSTKSNEGVSGKKRRRRFQRGT